MAGSEVGVTEEALGLVFSVDSPVDLPDSSPGDGVCLASNGLCTLRAAVMEANKVSGLDTIVLGTGVYELTIAGAGEDDAYTGDLDVYDPVTIRGEGVFRTRILASNEDRVFHFRAEPLRRGASVAVSNLTLEGGAVDGEGGGFFNDLSCTTSVTSVRVLGNRAHLGAGASNGRAARLTLDDVVFADNRAYEEAGGLANAGRLSADHVSIDHNRAERGTGGLFAGGTGTVRHSTLSRNTGNNPGGWSGTLTGGALVGGTFTFENVTVSGNSGDPGGVWVGGRADFIHSTIHDNVGGGLMNCDGCGASTTVLNSIVSQSEFYAGVNCAGTITSLGGNIDDGAGCNFVATGDQTNTDPLLAPLGRHLGRTEVHALDPRSPAVDNALMDRCSADDQRNVTRPQNGRCDVGAYEVLRDRFCVDTNADEIDDAPGDGACRGASGRCSLRAAVMETNALRGPDAVGFCVDGRFELSVTGAGEDAAYAGDLDVTDDLWLHGHGIDVTVVEGAGADRVFDVGPGARRVNVELEDLTLRRGAVGVGTGGFGGGLQLGGASVGALRRAVVYANTATYGVGLSGAGGGGISNDGVLVVEDARVDKNRVTGSLSLGGGILSAGSLRLVRTVVYGNAVAQRGGGLHIGGPAAVAELLESSVEENSASEDGGGISLSSSASVGLTSSRVDGNRATRWGGGVLAYGAVRALDTTFTRNAAFSGGGLWGTTTSLFTLERVTISGNSAGYVITGSAIESNGGANLTNVTISGNLGTGNAVVLANASLFHVTIADNDGGLRGSGVSLLNSIVGRSRSGASCGAPVLSSGYNISYDASCGLGASGDQPNTDPRLDVLANYGGPTLTHALMSGSPAIDAGSPWATVLPTDQRGHYRVGPSDIGAYEAP